MSELSAYSCPNCQIGVCRPEKTMYLSLYDGMLVSVPDMPVWVCDICQYQEYDPEVILRLEVLLGGQDNSSEAQRGAHKISPIDSLETTAARRIKP
ncbi:MAG: YgiT-type zinc finger protein [Anaerolineae bacterium]